MQGRSELINDQRRQSERSARRKNSVDDERVWLRWVQVRQFKRVQKPEKNSGRPT